MSQATLTMPALTSAEVAFYQEHGWLVTSNVLDSHLLDDAERGLERHWAGHRDHILAGAKEHYTDWMPGDGDGTRNNEYLSLQNKLVRNLAWSPIVGGIAAAAARTSSVRLFDDQIVYKPAPKEESTPSMATVGWHVDGDYWFTCSSDDMLTAWIPLHDCPAELGPLAVLDGSHLWSHKLDRRALSFHSKDMDSLERFVTDAGFEFKPIVLEMKRGQFSLHNARTIHGSYPNRGSRSRIAAAVHMQDASNRYVPSMRADGTPRLQFNDRICRKDANGQPDYLDNKIFPVLWSAS